MYFSFPPGNIFWSSLSYLLKPPLYPGEKVNEHIQNRLRYSARSDWLLCGLDAHRHCGMVLMTYARAEADEGSKETSACTVVMLFLNKMPCHKILISNVWYQTLTLMRWNRCRSTSVRCFFPSQNPTKSPNYQQNERGDASPLIHLFLQTAFASFFVNLWVWFASIPRCHWLYV